MKRRASQRLLDAWDSALVDRERTDRGSPDRLNSDLEYADGLLLRLSTVGEALINVFDDLPRLQDAMDENRQMSGMRNRLAHAYFDLDQDIVWSTLVDDIPELIVVLRGLIDLGEEELESRYGA